MKKILITGFEPFGDYAYNPTKELAEHFEGLIIDNEIQICGLVLPCTYYGAFKEVERIIDRENLYAIINVGLSTRIPKLHIEKVFYNSMESKYADADGLQPSGDPIYPNKNEAVHPHADIDFLMKCAREANLPVATSDDPGRFICNALGFHVSHKIKDENLATKNMFIHTPWTDDFTDKITHEPDKIFLKKEHLYKAIELYARNI